MPRLLDVLAGGSAPQAAFSAGWRSVPLPAFLPWAPSMLSLLDDSHGEALLPALEVTVDPAHFTDFLSKNKLCSLQRCLTERLDNATAGLPMKFTSLQTPSQTYTTGLQALAAAHPQRLFFPFRLSCGHLGADGQRRAAALAPLLSSPLLEAFASALNDTTYPAQRWDGWAQQLLRLLQDHEQVRGKHRWIVSRACVSMRAWHL